MEKDPVRKTRRIIMEKITCVIERRIYVGHKLHGDCITYEARVYIPQISLNLPKNVVLKWKFGVSKDGMVDPEGRTWVCLGENPGCGPRLPKELRDQHGKDFKTLTHAERKEFLTNLTPKS